MIASPMCVNSFGHMPVDISCHSEFGCVLFTPMMPLSTATGAGAAACRAAACEFKPKFADAWPNECVRCGAAAAATALALRWWVSNADGSVNDDRGAIKLPCANAAAFNEEEATVRAAGTCTRVGSVCEW